MAKIWFDEYNDKTLQMDILLTNLPIVISNFETLAFK